MLCYVHGLDLIGTKVARESSDAIKKCDVVLVNSHYTGHIAKSIGVEEVKIHLLHPAVAIPKQEQYDPSIFREKIHAGSRPILLSVGRLIPRKGLAEFIDLCFPQIVKKCPEVLYVIIGGEPWQSIYGDMGMTQKILDLAILRGVEENIKMLGQVDDKMLGEAYAASQLLVFPIIEHSFDVEGFGIVAIEAAAHGLPTVAFATGGVPDAVKNGYSGYLVAPGNYEELGKIICNHLIKPASEVSKESCIEFAKTFSSEMFDDRLKKICLGVLKNNI